MVDPRPTVDLQLVRWEHVASDKFRQAGIAADARLVASTARTLRRLEPAFITPIVPFLPADFLRVLDSLGDA